MRHAARSDARTGRARRGTAIASALAAVAVALASLGAPGAALAAPAATSYTYAPGVLYDVPAQVTVGEPIHLSGSGWVDTAGTAGSVIAVKLDEGGVSTTASIVNPATGAVQANKTIYAIAQADASGAWQVDLPWPTPAGSTAAWGAGETHSIRLLTGSLLGGDVIRSATANVTAVAAAPAATAPAVTTQPAARTIAAGADAVFTAAATGIPAPAVQWQSSADGTSWNDLAGATSTTLTVAHAGSAVSGTRYRAVFANAGGSATTDAATLTVSVPTPAVTLDASSYIAGATATVSGTGFIGKDGLGGVQVAVKPDDTTAKWVYGGADAVVPGVSGGLATFSSPADGTFAGTVTLPADLAAVGPGTGAHAGAHWLRFLAGSFGNPITAVSLPVYFTVAAQPTAPAVTTQPASTAVVEGAAATFTAAAEGTPAPTVQWFSQAPGGSWTAIAGATGATLSVPAASVADSGTRYKAVFTNGAGTVETSAATLTVTALPAGTHQGASDPGVRFTVPETVTAGSAITVSGTGWTTPTGTAGSVIGIKLDEGGVSTLVDVANPATGQVLANKTIWAAVQADASGTWTATVPYPTSANSNTTWAAGQTHSIRLLTGSLTAGDRVRSESASFAVVAPAEVVCTPGQVRVSDTANGQTAVACVQQDVSTTGIASLRITGSGWLTADGTAGATVVMKLASRATPSSPDFQFVRTGAPGDAVLTHPANGTADATMWAIVPADVDGSFSTTIAVPTAANVPATVGAGGALRAGSKLVLHLQTGVLGTDTVHSVDSAPLVVDGQAYAGDQDASTTACTPAGPAAVHLESADGSAVDPATGPVVAFGGTVRLVGTGFCNSDPARGGSVIAVKIDEGAFSHIPAEIVNANPQVWQVIRVDSADGSFAVDLRLPAAGSGSGASTPAFTTGTHSLRLLTGSLAAGDPIRTLQTGPFTVGAYQPNGVPAPVDAATLVAGNGNGVTVAIDGATLVATIPGADAGDWVFLTPFAADGSPRYPWGTWLRADASGRVSLPLTGVALPAGTLKVTAQSGDPGRVGALLGWGWLAVVAPPAAAGAPAADPPAVAAPGAPPAAAPRPALRVSRAVVAQAPGTVPPAPVANGDELTAADAGSVVASQDGTVVTLTVPQEPGAWVYLFAYSTPVPVGWIQVDAARQVRVDIAALPAGRHKIAVVGVDGALVGWAPATVASTAPAVASETDRAESDAASAGVTTLEVPAAPADAAGPTAADWWLIGAGAVVVVAGLLAAAIARRRRPADGGAR